MIQFDGVYYDGRSSARHPVRVLTWNERMHIVGAHVDVTVALADVVIAPPVANVRRMLALPDGAQLVTLDSAAVAALLPARTWLEQKVSVLEKHWQYALGALAITAAFTWWSLLSGMPAVAHFVAAFVPPAIESNLGKQTLSAIDRTLCKPTALTAARQRELQKTFDTVTAGLADGFNYSLKLRNCRKVGPNAFALPGGSVILTDDMAALAKNNDQLAAVLAHEVGHVRHRHALRLALQSAGAAALTTAIAGDAVSITGLAVTLPTILLQSGYSRALEEEADEYAFARLKEIGVSANNFADIMTLMEEQHQAKQAAKGEIEEKGSAASRLSDYLSTHPVTAERIQKAREYQ